MTLVGALLFIVVFSLLAWGAYAIITKFFSQPLQMPLLAVTGIVLLIVLLLQFVPEAANYRLWR